MASSNLNLLKCTNSNLGKLLICISLFKGDFSIWGFECKEVLLFLIKLIQLEQIGDIILNIFKGNSMLSSLMQVIGRNAVSIYILEKETINYGLYIVMIAWNLGDLIRYLFYTLKNNLLTYARFNAFIILYPIGIIGELICIENKKNRSDINGLYFRSLQIINSLGVLYLYIQLWNKSKKALNIKKD